MIDRGQLGAQVSAHQSGLNRDARTDIRICYGSDETYS
jgi:hypothetical protein